MLCMNVARSVRMALQCKVAYQPTAINVVIMKDPRTPACHAFAGYMTQADLQQLGISFDSVEVDPSTTDCYACVSGFLIKQEIVFFGASRFNEERVCVLLNLPYSCLFQNFHQDC